MQEKSTKCTIITVLDSIGIESESPHIDWETNWERTQSVEQSNFFGLSFAKFENGVFKTYF